MLKILFVVMLCILSMIIGVQIEKNTMLEGKTRHELYYDNIVLADGVRKLTNLIEIQDRLVEELTMKADRCGI